MGGEKYDRVTPVAHLLRRPCVLCDVKQLCLTCVLALLAWNASAQTVGLLSNTADAFDGYTLIAPTGATRTHLIDNCGRIVNQWDSEFRAGESAYLLEDGSLLRTCRQSSTVFNGGGIGGRIERFSWEGDLIWSCDLANDTLHHHHDMAWLPNGHVVLLAWEYKSPEEAAAAGRLSDDDGPLWPPVLLEIAPEGGFGGDIVWEWHAWDHLIQDVSPSFPNYGTPSEHPQRFDVNYGQVSGGGFPGGSSGGDWFHCNAVAYHPGLDQLILNSRNWNEFYILDHGISSEEAAGPAGDLLYRWGNPQAYGRGTEADRQLFQQHDPHWILEDGPAALGGDPEVTVLLYNNGNGRPGGNASTVDELTLPWDAASEGYVLPPEDIPFAPAELDWSWPENPTSDFHSPNISGAQRMPNGNTLICEGNPGHLFEIDPAGNVTWEYITAYNQFGAVNQGDSPFGNSTFRAYRYAPDYPGLAGRDLTPGPVVENNPLPLDCELHPAPIDTTAQNVQQPVLAFRFGPNPTSTTLAVAAAHPVRCTLRDVTGRLIRAFPGVARQHQLPVTDVPDGLYWLTIHDAGGRPLGTPRRILIAH